MKITIEGAKQAPSWEQLQKVVCDCLKSKRGQFVRISRKDGGCDYRGLGEYEVDFLNVKEHGFSENEIITLEIKN